MAEWKRVPLAEAAPPQSGEVDLWRISLAASDGEADLRILSVAERERAQRFVAIEARHRHVATRAALRRLLGAYLRISPERIELGESPAGKPFLIAGPEAERLEFNCSHAETTALIAFARQTPVGIDLENIERKLDPAAIAQRWFTEQEQAAWAAAKQSRLDFFRVWTRKEAVLKAHGGGLSAGLDKFSVAAGMGKIGVLWPPLVAWEGGTFAVYGIDPGEGMIGALAVMGGGVGRLRLLAV